MTEENTGDLQQIWPDRPLQKHMIPFYSLSSSDDANELRKYYKRFADLRHNESIEHVDNYYLDCKLVGVPVQLFFNERKLVLALTKFNGREGEDVTELMQGLPNLPTRIRTERSLIIRGEIVIHRTDFYNLNDDLSTIPSAKPMTYATMLDCIVDTLRQRDVDLIISRSLRFYAWELFLPKYKRLTLVQQIQDLGSLGFSTPKGELCTSLADMTRFINETARTRNQLPYAIDGIVIKQNDPNYSKQVGCFDDIEYGKTVWHFNDNGLPVTVKNIRWEISMDGRLNPYIQFKEINLNGLVATEAPMHTASRIEDLGVDVGAKVLIRAVGSQAKMDSVIKPVKVDLPKVCPVCGKPLTRNDTDLICTNPNCQGILEDTLTFIARSIVREPRLTRELAHQIVEKKIVTSLIDIFKPLNAQGDAQLQDILDEFVDRVIYCSPVDLIMLLGIPGIKRANANKIAAEAYTVPKLIELFGNEETLNYFQLGEQTTKDFVHWYEIPEHKQFLEQLKEIDLPGCS